MFLVFFIPLLEGTLPADVLERLEKAIGFMADVEWGHFLGKKRAHEEQDPNGPAPVPPPKITRDYNDMLSFLFEER